MSLSDRNWWFYSENLEKTGRFTVKTRGGRTIGNQLQNLGTGNSGKRLQAAFAWVGEARCGGRMSCRFPSGAYRANEDISVN